VSSQFRSPTFHQFVGSSLLIRSPVLVSTMVSQSLRAPLVTKNYVRTPASSPVADACPRPSDPAVCSTSLTRLQPTERGRALLPTSSTRALAPLLPQHIVVLALNNQVQGASFRDESSSERPFHYQIRSVARPVSSFAQPLQVPGSNPTRGKSLTLFDLFSDLTGGPRPSASSGAHWASAHQKFSIRRRRAIAAIRCLSSQVRPSSAFPVFSFF
jgi:hypothetical protein